MLLADCTLLLRVCEGLVKGGKLLEVAAGLEKPETTPSPRKALGTPALEFRLAEVVTLHAAELRYIEAVLSAVGGNKQRAAALLGISRKTIYRRLGLLKD